jgi:hypothetical protein
MDRQDITNKIVVELGLEELLWVVPAIAVVQFLLALWLKARLEGSIKHSYDTRLKDYEFQLKIREQAARVAEFLAFAFSPQADPMRFNQLAWELSLWLPAPLVCDISRCLARDVEAKTPKQILIEVRKILLQAPNDPLLAENILHREDPRGQADLTAALTTNPLIRQLDKRL